MKRKMGIFSLILAACLTIVSSCATTTLDAVWSDPNYQGGKLQDVLVIAVAKLPTNRRLFEDKFVAQLKSYGINAIASYTIIPSEEKLDKKTVDAAIKKLGIDAVIETRLVDMNQEKQYIPRSGRFGPLYTGDDWYGGYSRGYELANAPGYFAIYKVARLETNVYYTKTEKLIWSSLSDTIIQDTVENAIDSVIKAIVKSLTDNKLI
jgi:hypothetical protein